MHCMYNTDAVEVKKIIAITHILTTIWQATTYVFNNSVLTELLGNKLSMLLKNQQQ